MLLARLRVAAVSRPSPSYARIELAGGDLAEFGVEGPFYDQRIKLLFPGSDGLPELSQDSWWSDFAALPEETRGSVRTYTVADTFGAGLDARLQVDFVIHPGAHGPGSDWALGASEGDELLAVLPRKGAAYGGIEFAPGGAKRVLLVGDETALPAITQILRAFPDGTDGTVFLEVPLAGDIVPLPEVAGVMVHWLPRDGRPVGDLAVAAVGEHLGFAAVEGEVEIDPDLWETPVHSSSGEPLESAAVDDRYAWIAGESSMVTRLRRHLVGELGMPRAQVAFMGYWREGVAMRG
ncbi:siderophore-interacting protein [Nocardioides marmorisolisilvae]|uniref:Siderophore-interacting protein n=1 Tax=Nocardioides marmorisolisilvae TaxID=1542737 RepID=A0A3N0DRT2_9ACTN|nr:siderophore-interacting protein [Nocardioides marmorisolisilvae]RNL78347.1 siderophore-interacting protein [Nocardioides marmorisolisilvae]